MDSTVITRRQAAIKFRQRVAVKTLAGDMLVGTFLLPSGLENGKSIRISKVRLEDRIPGDHAWPEDGVKIRVRVPDWRIRNSIVGLLVFVGMVAGAWPYVGLLVAVWAAVALSQRHSRLHKVDRFDPTVHCGFWSTFRDTLAGTATLFLVPIGAVIAFYLVVASVFTVFGNLLTIHQLVVVQQAFSGISDFFDDSVKLKEGPMLLALVGVWLLTCLLLARMDHAPAPADGPAEQSRSVRYRLARAVNTLARSYARYSGPAAATLTALASFTFLTTVPGALGTQLALRTATETQKYTYAAKNVEADLTAEVLSQLYAEIGKAMPSTYQHVLVISLPSRNSQTQQQGSQFDVPFQDGDPAAAQRLAAEESRIQNLQTLPAQSVVNGPRNDDPVDIPNDITPRSADAARQHVSSNSQDGRVKIINDSGKEVLLQLEKVASEDGWSELKKLVSSRFPLAAPMVDALAEACDKQLQDTLREKIPGLVKLAADKVGNLKSSIAATARNVVAAKDVPRIVQNHAAEAERVAKDHQATVDYAKSLEGKMQARGDIVDGLTHGTAFDDSIKRMRESTDRYLQTAVVDDLRRTMQTADPSKPGASLLQHNAAVAIHTLGEGGLPMITEGDIRAALPFCGC